MGDTLHYEYTVCENQGFSICTPIAVSKTAQKSAGFAELGLFLFGASLIAVQRRRTLIRSLVMLIFLFQFLLASCGGGGGGTSPVGGGSQDLRQVVTNLAPNTTYFWRITAIDSEGDRTNSSPRRFTT